jgi:hypothetical protein
LKKWSNKLSLPLVGPTQTSARQWLISGRDSAELGKVAVKFSVDDGIIQMIEESIGRKHR